MAGSISDFVYFDVSIPKRVSVVLRLSESYRDKYPPLLVSIPKRVSVVLRLALRLPYSALLAVSIPKRVSVVLRH